MERLDLSEFESMGIMMHARLRRCCDVCDNSPSLEGKYSEHSDAKSEARSAEIFASSPQDAMRLGRVRRRWAPRGLSRCLPHGGGGVRLWRRKYEWRHVRSGAVLRSRGFVTISATRWGRGWGWGKYDWRHVNVVAQNGRETRLFSLTAFGEEVFFWDGNLERPRGKIWRRKVEKCKSRFPSEIQRRARDTAAKSQQQLQTDREFGLVSASFKRLTVNGTLRGEPCWQAREGRSACSAGKRARGSR